MIPIFFNPKKIHTPHIFRRNTIFITIYTSTVHIRFTETRNKPHNLEVVLAYLTHFNNQHAITLFKKKTQKNTVYLSIISTKRLIYIFDFDLTN